MKQGLMWIILCEMYLTIQDQMLIQSVLITILESWWEFRWWSSTIAISRNQYITVCTATCFANQTIIGCKELLYIGSIFFQNQAGYGLMLNLFLICLIYILYPIAIFSTPAIPPSTHVIASLATSRDIVGTPEIG